MDIQPAFDRYQFDRAPRKVSRLTRLDFSDGMRLKCRSTPSRRWSPIFANNDGQLRTVIAKTIWQSAHGGKVTMPAHFKDDMKIVNRLANKNIARFRNGKHCGRFATQRHIEINEQMPWVRLLAAIAYYSWRLLWKAPDVAEQVGIQPCHVRILRYRMCETARRLGFETFDRAPSYHYWKGKKRKSRPFVFTLDDINKIVALWNKGLSTTEIAAKIDFAQWDICKLLKARGLWYYRRKRRARTRR